MKLFAPEKNLIHKILNGILVIWFVAAIVICFSFIVNYFLNDVNYTKDEFEIVYCGKGEVLEEEIYSETECNAQYAAYVLREDDDLYLKRSLIFSVGQIIIVGSALVVLNLKKEEGKPSKTKK